ncbi:GntR family transcriptional regulator [Sphingomonas koreensis]|nr:GntR family transcriptional regulator [Sphingomonas koreensis]
MNSGQTTERVYDRLKQQLLSGALVPGERLEPVALADNLASSATPVRDALYRLLGERLVDARPSEGFYVPAVNEPGLRDLYAWNGLLIRAAIATWSRDVSAPMANELPIGVEHATRALFARCAERSGNLEIAAQVEAASDRLSAARHVEAQLLEAPEVEVRDLASAFDYGGNAALIRLIGVYHRRRLRIVPNIVRGLYRA